MVFSTPVFLFYFLVLTLLVYYLVPRKLRNVVILISSLIFYYWGEQTYVVIMFLSTAIDFTHGMLVEHFKGKGQITYAKMAVASSMFFNLLLLLFFKYWDFLASSLQAIGLNFMPVLGIHLPIGISFYTFQTMSYTIDVYRGDTRAQRNIINFGTFVTLFPQLIAGPIIKYKDLGDQIDQRDTSIDKFGSGVQMFMIGLGKKILIANNVGMLWDSYKAMAASDLTVAGAWLGVVAFTFQIYFDFSGYSDMAVGLGRMLGFEFLPNFDHPYISRSITEFWRRWHISLSTWFKEYLYIPLGGNRCSKGRWVFNLFVVWAATGIWHGASWNYVIWGLYFFVLLLMEKLWLGRLLSQLPKVVQHVYTLVLCAGELGHLCPGGLRTAGRLPEGHVRHGRSSSAGQCVRLLSRQLSPHLVRCRCGIHQRGRFPVPQTAPGGSSGGLRGSGGYRLGCMQRLYGGWDL